MTTESHSVSGRVSNDFDKLQVECDRLAAWLRDNAAQSGTDEFRKAVLTHRLLTDLLAADGGTPEMRREVIKRLADL